MPLVKLKDGSYVRVEDEPTPQRLRELGATVVGRAPGVTSQRSVRAGSEEAEVAKRVKASRPTSYLGKVLRPTDNAVNVLSGAITMGADDKLLSGLNAVFTGGYNAISKGDIGEIGKEYRISRDTLKARRDEARQENPLLGFASEIAGALASPVGASSGVAKGVGAAGRMLTRKAPSVAAKVVPAVQRAAASAPVRAIAKVGESNIGRATRAGLNQGAVYGAINPGEDGVLDSAYRGATGGALGGAVLGTAGNLGIKGVRAYMERAPKNASRVAYGKVGQMLERAPNENMPAGTRYTPESAAQEIEALKATGHEPMVGDLSTEMHNTMGYLARKPQLDSANALEKAARDRTEQAGDRFNQQVEDVFGTGPNAHTLKKGIRTEQQAHGKEAYKAGGSMDAPLNKSNQLDELLREERPSLTKALKGAYDEMLDRGELPATLNQGPNGSFTHIPSQRAFDYVKRWFDDEMTAAYTAGKTKLAQRHSDTLQQVKDIISDANPEYGKILAKQKDFFQQQQSLEMGRTLFGGKATDVRQLLDDMKIGKVKTKDFLDGVRDNLLHMRDKTDNPVAMLRKAMRNPDTRAVLEFALGGKKQLNQFDRFIRNEIRSADADKMVARGRQSATNIFEQQGDMNASEGLTDTLHKMLTGQAFGGVTGAVSAGVRGYDRMKRGLGSDAQNELAKILMGSGEGLAEGVANARSVEKMRAQLDKARTEKFGKAAAASLRGN